MNPILVATDFTPASTKAFSAAVDLAGRLKVELVVVFVQNLTDLRFALHAGIQDSLESTTVVKKRVRSSIDRNFEELLKSGKSYSSIQTIVRKGEPWVEIIKLAKGIKAQMIVAGTRGRSATAGLILGSTAQQLIRSAPCPVLVVRAGK